MSDPGWWTAVGTSVMHFRQESGLSLCERTLYWLDEQVEPKLANRCGYCMWRIYRAS